MSERIERIEKYLLGEMPEQEKESFELELQSDPQLQEEVARMHIIGAALEVSIEDELRKQLKKLEARYVESESKIPQVKIRNLYARLAVAASMFIIISAGLWYMFRGGTSDIEQFSERHYMDYDYKQVRGEFSESDFPYEFSDNDFDKKEASEWLVKWLEVHPSDDEASFMLADILKDLGRIGEAKEQLGKIMAQNSIRWGEKAEWNYVLLSAGDHWNDPAESTLQKILNDPSHSYHIKAKELAAMLKK